MALQFVTEIFCPRGHIFDDYEAIRACSARERGKVYFFLVSRRYEVQAVSPIAVEGKDLSLCRSYFYNVSNDVAAHLTSARFDFEICYVSLGDLSVTPTILRE
jgi:hypothetical protein